MADVKRFFDDYLNIKKIVEEKREYKAMMARVDALPEDYKYVYKKIQNYMWKFASGSGYDVVEIQEGMLELFEQGVAEGKTVIEITGDDVAGFADELMKEARTYTEKWGDDLNADIAKKLN